MLKVILRRAPRLRPDPPVQVDSIESSENETPHEPLSRRLCALVIQLPVVPADAIRTCVGMRKNRPTLEKKTHFPVFPFHLIDFCSRFLSKSKPLNIIYCVIAAKRLLL